MPLKRLLSVLALLASLVASVRARADAKPPVVIWPTLTPAGDAPAAGPLHKPAAADKDLFERAQELDATLRDAVQDLGFTLYLADPGPASGHKRDEDLLERASRSAAGDAPESGTWVVSPRVESVGGGQYVVRIVAVPPRGRELRVRVDTVPSDSVSVRGLVMLRDMLSPPAAALAATEQDHERAAQGTSQGIMSPLRSPGRAVLAVNAALYGAFTAFSVQRASGSSDPRVLYPLLALGTGMGIGGALLVADEWDVSAGDAWFLAAGGWWSAASAFLIAAGHDVQPLDDRYAWGVGGGLVGLSLATFALTRTTMDEGDAMIAHSGGALGLLVGGASELLYRGTTTNVTPHTGMGYGTAIGTLAAGILATQATVSPSRVLLIDVGAGGGALLGAAAASPLIFENQTKPNTRAWLSAAIGGSVAGGIATWWLTRNLTTASSRARLPGSPSLGVIAMSPTRGGSTPAYGVAWGGAF
ncbi:MAG: hypothetical protein M3O50_05030 [Myxococcota bacterium]|nr:hypothetical protein [Myxococcota bacterium]